MTFAEAVAVPCTKIFGCGIGTAKATVLDRVSAVTSAIERHSINYYII
jgi:hypothetical protein